MIIFDAFILISSPKGFGDMCYETDLYKFKKYLSLNHMFLIWGFLVSKSPWPLWNGMRHCVSTCMCTFGGGKWFIISNRHSEGSVLRQNTKKLIQKQLLKSSTESNLEAFPHLRQSKHCSGKQWKWILSLSQSFFPSMSLTEWEAGYSCWLR